MQSFLSLAFLFFVLDLAITSFAASALSLWRPVAVQYFGIMDSSDRRVVMWWATFVSSLLFGLLLAAFIFLGLVMAAYVGPTGWATLAFMVIFGLIGIGVIIWLSPIGSPPPEDGRTLSWKIAEEEKLDRYSHGPRYAGDEEEYHTGGREDYEKEGGMVDDRYVDDDGLSRRPTVVVRPSSVVVPDYQNDLRRYRALKGSGNYSNYDGRGGY